MAETKRRKMIRPVGEYVVLEKRTVGKNAIVLPSFVEDGRVAWFVVRVGPDCKRLKAGDEIAYNSDNDGAKLKLDDKEYVIMSEGFIVGVIESVEND